MSVSSARAPASIHLPNEAIIDQELESILPELVQIAQIGPPYAQVVNAYALAVKSRSYSKLFLIGAALEQNIPAAPTAQKVIHAMQNIKAQLSFIGRECESRDKILQSEAERLMKADIEDAFINLKQPYTKEEIDAEYEKIKASPTAPELFEEYKQRAQETVQLSYPNWMMRYLDDLGNAYEQLLTASNEEETVAAKEAIQNAIYNIEKTKKAACESKKPMPRVEALYQHYQNRLAIIDPDKSLYNGVMTWTGAMKSTLSTLKQGAHLLSPLVSGLVIPLCLQAGVSYMLTRCGGAYGERVGEATRFCLHTSTALQLGKTAYSFYKMGEKPNAAIMGVVSLTLLEQMRREIALQLGRV